MFRIFIILLTALFVNNAFSQDLPQGVITKIAFGSCNFQWSKQRMWKPIMENKPQLWIWLGDNIYSETYNMDEMERMYNRQKENKNYKKLIACTKNTRTNSNISCSKINSLQIILTHTHAKIIQIISGPY